MSVATTTDPQTSVRPLRRETFEALVEQGHFAGERVELLEGVLVQMPPMSDRHARAITLLTKWLVRGLGDDVEVGPQVPLAASAFSEPEPDISVTRVRTVGSGHPQTAELAIEVTPSTHPTDLEIKPVIYAAAGIPQYWVIDLAADRAVVHSDPGDDGYAQIAAVHAPATLMFRGVSIDLAELLRR
ncbi:Uma2 family endonuclease [Euzebya tangerina]|uniref:Uma2 family endonuclease n=1 Tax=Euzebya tangerina TaxID=591198 RepID=UPI0013C2AC9E|nr:Uma2 family endonuclease [Euzebya tangerina]